MLVRVRGGKNGVAEYLRDGMKADREQHRDLLDNRICIDGDLTITDYIIKDMVKADREENYFHITLSFAERDITEETIRNVYDDYKSNLMSAYEDDEFNIYAEIHYPKIKSYTDKKTGELVERFPHVHIVLPKKNLLTDKNLNPFGFYKTNLKFFDAIQEKINIDHELASPLDNQRVFKLDQSELLSRYKGDNFKGSNGELKAQILDAIHNKNISDMDSFKAELSNYGEVSIGKAGKPDEYLKLKPSGSTRNIRLMDSCFKPDFIENRIIKREKPTLKQLTKDVNEWTGLKSHEVKYIHAGSPKLRTQYQELPTGLKGNFLNEQRERFYRRYQLTTNGTRAGLHDSSGARLHDGTTSKQRDIPTSRWPSNRKFSLERGRPRGFTTIPHGLPSVSQLNVDTAGRQRRNSTTKLLHDHAPNNMGSRQLSGNNQLRRSSYEPRRRIIQSSIIRTPSINNTLFTVRKLKLQSQQSENYADQLHELHKEHKHTKDELSRFREIRKSLKAENLLNHLAKTHGVIKDQYDFFSTKDGSMRIRTGTRAYNVSDFCTQHVGLSWDETKDILKTVYGQQRQQMNRNKEQYAVNSIVFVSNQVTQGWKNNTSLDESIKLLRRLQQKEKTGVLPMALSDLERHRSEEPTDNIIHSGSEDFSLSEKTKRILKAREVAAQINLTMNDLVVNKNEKKRLVEFSDKNTGDKIFTDDGQKIIMKNRKPDVNHTATALTLAAEKYGVVKITGSREFKEQVIDVAISKNLNVVFANKALQSTFIERKKELVQAHNENKSSQTHSNNEDTPSQQDTRANQKSTSTPAYKTTYQWNATTEKMEFKVNGESPFNLDPSALGKMAKIDSFLKHYDLTDLRTGQLDLKKANGTQPIPTVYDHQLKVVNEQNNDDSKRHTMKG